MEVSYEKQGKKVKLISVKDDYTDVKPGMIGTIDFLDDAGTVHCTWENGSCLGLIPGIDEWEEVPCELQPDS